MSVNLLGLSYVYFGFCYGTLMFAGWRIAISAAGVSICILGIIALAERVLA